MKLQKEKKGKQPINKDMTFSQIIRKYPKASEVLFKEGMMCAGCPMAMQETIEQGCKAHGINVKKFLEKLNKKIKEKE
ncbi:MAG: DUF1858 domain-containing protein [Candidatus Pacearchaeota archaeon]|nr:DUF1858 domain-containing protein [Candidatus Pacearchaeota archaeon]